MRIHCTYLYLGKYVHDTNDLIMKEMVDEYMFILNKTRQPMEVDV